MRKLLILIVFLVFLSFYIKNERYKIDGDI